MLSRAWQYMFSAMLFRTYFFKLGCPESKKNGESGKQVSEEGFKANEVWQKYLFTFMSRGIWKDLHLTHNT